MQIASLGNAAMKNQMESAMKILTVITKAGLVLHSNVWTNAWESVALLIMNAKEENVFPLE